MVVVCCGEGGGRGAQADDRTGVVVVVVRCGVLWGGWRDGWGWSQADNRTGVVVMQ